MEESRNRGQPERACGLPANTANDGHSADDEHDGGDVNATLHEREHVRLVNRELPWVLELLQHGDRNHRLENDCDCVQ